MAKNVLPKHWNGSEFEELHIVTKASNVFTNDNKSVQQKIDDFTSHLAQTAKQSVFNLAYGDINVAGKNASKTTVTFISDDGFLEDYTILKPIFESEGVPFSLAIVSDWVGNYRSMNIAQIKEIEAMGCEILSHTKTHRDLSILSEEEIENELKISKDALKSMGFNVNHIVYPYGGYNNLVKKISRKYYRAGYLFGNTGQTNKQPYDTYAIKRISLGAYFDSPNSAYPITNTFEDYYKPMVDKAVENNEWLIITLHPGASSGEFTVEQQNYLRETIQYIKSLNIPIKNPSDVLDEMGNLIDVVGYSTDNQEKYFKVGGDGSVEFPKLEWTIAKNILNGWESDPNNPIRYLKDPFGTVYIRGRAIPTNATSEFIMVLPEEYRPDYNCIVSSITGLGNPVGKVYAISGSGYVGVPEYIKTVPYYSLDELTYIAR